jgi:hypothetical protein
LHRVQRGRALLRRRFGDRLPRHGSHFSRARGSRRSIRRHLHGPIGRRRATRSGPLLRFLPSLCPRHGRRAGSRRGRGRRGRARSVPRQRATALPPGSALYLGVPEMPGRLRRLERERQIACRRGSSGAHRLSPLVLGYRPPLRRSRPPRADAERARSIHGFSART